MDAIDASPYAARLRDMMSNPSKYTVNAPDPVREDRTVEVVPNRAYLDYLLSPEELFARAYAQYIASRSEDPEMLEELDRRREEHEGGYPQQWPDAEFAPIAGAFDAMFGGLGWRA